MLPVFEANEFDFGDAPVPPYIDLEPERMSQEPNTYRLVIKRDCSKVGMEIARNIATLEDAVQVGEAWYRKNGLRYAKSMVWIIPPFGNAFMLDKNVAV